jgi:hypothetical protein
MVYPPRKLSGVSSGGFKTLISNKSKNMNEKQQNQFAASLFRTAFLLKVIDYEMNHFAKFKAPSGIKNEFNRMAKVYRSGLINISLHMPQTKDIFKGIVTKNDERILAISAIVEKLSVMPLEQVQQVENDLSGITVNYK